MKNVITRSISGIVYIAVLVAAILSGGSWLASLLALMAVIGSYELAVMLSKPKIHRFLSIIDYAVNALIVIGVYFAVCPMGGPAGKLLAIAGALILAREIAQLYSHDPSPVNNWSHSVLSYIYIGVPLATIPVIYYAVGSSHIVLALLIFIWINDTGAYCVGSLIGKHRLFERISPKKSWEGFFGGLAFVLGAAAVMHYCFPTWYGQYTIGRMLLIAALTAIFATLGDLAESLIKRSAGVKDSGNLIPGHGGILDRIDSLLLVAPAIALVLYLF
ncbi:MAG: phosphatidate cytidylyltransferase [Muribaculaceae bacterium]|nr:phosphatidate cytidylyltransferase [Muribaculaceae bacterium]